MSDAGPNGHAGMSAWLAARETKQEQEKKLWQENYMV